MRSENCLRVSSLHAGMSRYLVDEILSIDGELPARGDEPVKVVPLTALKL